MNRRKAKQIIIAVIFFAILGTAVFSGYSIIRIVIQDKLTCFDGILNQNEEGPDCGGVCLTECEKDKEDIEVLFYKIIPTLPEKYNVVLKFHNPNNDYGSAEVGYKLNFFDESNSLIGSHEDFTYILPLEKKSIIVTALNFSVEPKNITVEFKEISWLKLQEFGDSRQINVRDKFYRELTDLTVFGEAKGVAVNRSGFDFDDVDISILLFDSNKNIIDAATMEIRSLLSGEEREFIARWFYPVAYPNSLEIYAETNVFKSENFMKRYGGAERFQEF